MPWTSERRVLHHGRPRSTLQPGLKLHLRRLEQVRRGDGPRTLWPRQQLQAAADLENGELQVPEWDTDFNQPWMPDGEKKWEASPAMGHWEDMAWRVQHDAEEVLLDRARWLRETTGAKNLCLAGGVALNCVVNGR